jgi:hypothetical protein|tara:strand:- start:40357 stop:40797 length:441 start_codon:yes stop_codon:yes gene_type:complete
MSKYQSIIEVLQRNRRAMPIDANGLQQKITKFNLLKEELDSAFVEDFAIEENTKLGLEWVKAGTILNLHTDTQFGRRCNLLINIGTNTATVQHSNNDVLEQVHIQPDGVFLLDTTKPHGCENNTDEDMMFLTINWSKRYDELQHRF